MSSSVKSLALLSLVLICSSGESAPIWIEQASRPGSNTPTVGQSRFDQLFLAADGSYQIPFPFDSLIESLEARLDNGENPAVRQVFVPIGRSLQRQAPAPDYFHFPRRVIATEGEPVTIGNEAGLVIEYRLFIAHQPKTETLEIISYNDDAGRFEFQLVENYAANASMRVMPANRVMCLSCHQNAAPIFARIPWSETSFNVEVAARLVDALPHRFASLIGTVTTDAGVIDVLVERANYLSVAQLIWRQGCSSRLCRAAMLRAILQYRLSGESNFEASAASYRQDYLDELARNWELNWPEGLALPGSRIDDRNPFTGDTLALEHDPLIARPPHATWYRVDPALARGIIYRLAGFLTLADIRRIDQHLIAAANDLPPARYQYKAACSVINRNTTTLVLSCGDRTRAESMQASLEVEVLRDRIESLRMTSLRVPQDANLLQPDVAVLSRLPGKLELIPVNNEAGLSQRLATGDRIGSMVLSWKGLPGQDTFNLEIEVSAESGLIDRALNKLLDDRWQDSGDSLANNVFRRKSVLRALLQALDMTPFEWPEEVEPEIVVSASSAGRLSGELALLEPYCAHCHGDDSTNPPGFLAGDDPLQKILQCTPRILLRLKAWQYDYTIVRSPMPPVASLEFSGMTADDWPSSDHYRTIVTALEELVFESHGEQTLKSWQKTEYDRLPPCLATINE